MRAHRLIPTGACLQRTSTPRSSSMSRRWMGTWPKVSPRRVRVISMDVTGTMVSFSGRLEDHYGDAARYCGVKIRHAERVEKSFHLAYKETTRRYPCFGNDKISSKDWWRQCVLRSFELAGVEMTREEKERVFQRVYSLFGSHAAYAAFIDSKPFLNWARRNNIVCGVLSNADERYGDSILPMLGLVDDLSFLCFSKDLNVEKPDARAYSGAMTAAAPWLLNTKDPLLPSQVLHIGNDYAKDFEGARRAGMHAALLDRFGEVENAEEWRRRGAPVFNDLLDVVEFLGRCKCQLG